MTLLVALALVASCTTAQAETELRWKFKNGEKTNFEMKMEMTQDTKAGDMPFQVKISQLMDMTWEVTEVADDGRATMNQTIDRVRMEMSLPQGQTIKYDTKNPEKAPGTEMLAKMFDAMVGKPFVLRVTPLGTVEDFKAPAGMLEALKNSPMAQAGGMFSEDGLKQMISQSMLPLPEKAVSEGTTWEKKAEVKTPPFGKQLTTTVYKFVGPQDRDGKMLDKIDVTLDMKIEPAEGTEAKLTLKDNKAGGEVLWDNAGGKPLESNINSTMTFELAVGGMSIEQSVTTKVTMKQVTAAREL